MVCAAAQPIAVDLPITLGQFVKLAGFAATGGEAKRIVIEELVRVNGRIETRRGHKLAPGDVVEARGAAAEVIARTTSLAKTGVPAGEPGARARAAVPEAAADQQLS
jgi:ribosome-associated protein